MRHVKQSRRSSTSGSTVRRSKPCRPTPTNTPNGSRSASTSTTTSPSMITSTASRTPWSANRCGAARPSTPWSSSTTANASPPTCEASSSTTTAPIPSIAPLRTGRTWSGRPRADRLGRSVGAHTAAVIEHVIRSKPHPEQGYRSALGILRLSRTFSPSGSSSPARGRSISAPRTTAPSKPCSSSAWRARCPMNRPLRNRPQRLGAANVRGPRYYH